MYGKDPKQNVRIPVVVKEKQQFLEHIKPFLRALLLQSNHALPSIWSLISSNFEEYRICQLLLEHPHTLTLGRRAKDDGIIVPEEVLREHGVTVFETNRGGKVTYHGLGQVVGYPIINLSPDREDVHRFVRDLEEVLIRAVSDFGIEAFRIKGLTGVHTSRGKVAAIGVHIARWVTTHGFALNVNTDLTYFDWIIACEGEPVTSMKELLGREVEIGVVEDRIIDRFAEVFEMEFSHGGTEAQRIEGVMA